MLARILALLSPLIVLAMATFCASLLAYVIILIAGDTLSFRTLFKKCTQFFLVVSIFPLMRYLNLNALDLGIAPRKQLFSQFKTGFGIAFITLLPVLMLFYALEIHLVDEGKPWTTGWVSKKLGLEWLLACLIAVVEEPIFRGALLTGLSKKFSLCTAVVVSAFYYALLHFVNSNIEIPYRDVEFYSGFILLGDALVRILNANYLSPFLSLWTVGLFLALLKTKNRASLALCIGCHAGWVWQIKLSKAFFNINPNSDFSFLISKHDGVIGPLVTAWLALAIVGYLLYNRAAHRKQRHPI